MALWEHKRAHWHTVAHSPSSKMTVAQWKVQWWDVTPSKWKWLIDVTGQPIHHVTNPSPCVNSPSFLSSIGRTSRSTSRFDDVSKDSIVEMSTYLRLEKPGSSSPFIAKLPPHHEASTVGSFSVVLVGSSSSSPFTSGCQAREEKEKNHVGRTETFLSQHDRKKMPCVGMKT